MASISNLSDRICTWIIFFLLQALLFFLSQSDSNYANWGLVNRPGLLPRGFVMVNVIWILEVTSLRSKTILLLFSGQAWNVNLA